MLGRLRFLLVLRLYCSRVLAGECIGLLWVQKYVTSTWKCDIKPLIARHFKQSHNATFTFQSMLKFLFKVGRDMFSQGNTLPLSYHFTSFRQILTDLNIPSSKWWMEPFFSKSHFPNCPFLFLFLVMNKMWRWKNSLSHIRFHFESIFLFATLSQINIFVLNEDSQTPANLV